MTPVIICGWKGALVGARELSICDTCTPLGTCRLGIDDLRSTEDGGVRGAFAVPEHARGHVVAHGGWIAWVFDEALGLLPHGHGEWAITKSLAITYERPVPVGALVAVHAWLEGADGSRRRLRGELALAGTDVVLASAVGEWIVVEDAEAHYDRARAWSERVLAAQ